LALEKNEILFVSSRCTSDSAFRILIFDWGKQRLGLEGVQNLKHILYEGWKISISKQYENIKEINF